MASSDVVDQTTFWRPRKYVRTRVICYVLEVMGFHKSTLVARGANTQLDPNCVSAPPATNVDLFECFAERLFKSSSIGPASLAREN